MLSFVEVKGKDAAEFLHRVTAGTVRGVGTGEGRPGLLLNGQSRVLAQFDLLRLADDHFLLAAPEECAGTLADELEKLHFAESLGISPTERRAWPVPAEGSARGDGAFAFRGGGAELAWPSPVPGFDYLAGPKVSGGKPPGWEESRIAALVPWPGSEWKAGETPALEAGMLPWIDRFKGCYPGQEVVELSLNVGHPARVLVAVEGDAPWEGAAVTSFARESGRPWRALVRLPWAKRDNFPAGISCLKAHW